MSESIICKVVVSPSAYDLIPGFLNECKCSLIVTTLGVAEAIKRDWTWMEYWKVVPLWHSVIRCQKMMYFLSLSGRRYSWLKT